MARKRYNLRQFLINAARKLTERYPPKEGALRNATTTGSYRRCADCKKEFHYSVVQADHTEPAIEPGTPGPQIEPGLATGWDEYYSRLFCTDEQFQALCIFDHKKKTDAENKRRKKR